MYELIKQIVEDSNIFFQFLIAIGATLGILVVLKRIFQPKINCKIISFYHTFNEKKQGFFILKLSIDSTTDLVVKDMVFYINQGDKITLTKSFMPRPLLTIFKMLDFHKKEADYILLKPWEPNLRNGIKAGINDYYIALKSEEVFEDKSINSWKIELNTVSSLLLAPISFTQKKIVCNLNHPKDENLYFDDFLWRKISPEEREQIISQS